MAQTAEGCPFEKAFEKAAYALFSLLGPRLKGFAAALLFLSALSGCSGGSVAPNAPNAPGEKSGGLRLEELNF